MEVSWVTSQPTASAVVFGAGSVRRVEDFRATRTHRLTLRDLKPSEVYAYQMVTPAAAGRPPAASHTFHFDTRFNYTLQKVGEAAASPYPQDARTRDVRPRGR